MEYIGIYWTLFAPIMKKSITNRFGKELEERSIRRGRREYRKLLSHADGPQIEEPAIAKNTTLTKRR